MVRRDVIVLLGFSLFVATQAAAGPPVPGGKTPLPQPTLTAPRVVTPSTAGRIPAGLKPLKGVPLVPRFTPLARPTLHRPVPYSDFCYVNKPCQLRVSGFGAERGNRSLVMEDVSSNGKPLAMPIKEWDDDYVTFIPLIVVRDKAQWANGYTRSVKVMLRDPNGNVLSNTISFAVGLERPKRDGDGDGRVSMETGGDDCDDGDRLRFPGNHELPDAEDHDEDCDYKTFGLRDQDGDGFPDANSCNYDPNTHEWFCGNDCDDTNPAIFPGEQVCDPRSPSSIFVCGASRTLPTRWTQDPRKPGGYWDSYDCNAIRPGSTCLAQPNGRGICQ
jgi:hypothetical protein